MKLNNTDTNILCTYASCGTSKPLINLLMQLSDAGEANIMIDSGAFTAFNAKTKYTHINVKDYCAFLQEYGSNVEKYVMLDVIGNADASKKNYEEMVSKNLSPMFVATMFDKDYDYINSTLDINPNICVAGGVTTKSDWMTKRFQDIYLKTDKRARIHGLGYVTFPKMLQLNLASVDSSSWKAAPLRFGSLQYFMGGVKSISMADIRKANKVTNREVIKLFEQCNITPSMLADKSNHKGNYSIQCLLSIIAHEKMQKYCYSRGLRYFLAVNNVEDVKKVIYVKHNWNNWNYNEFRCL